jgi:glycine cleavage system H protein
MPAAKPTFLQYKRSRFTTQLPVAYRYFPSHYWMAEQQTGLWRVGLTKFATRMLGEMVDYGFDVKPHATVDRGQILGWIEGFKAIADIFCAAEGRFAEVNVALKDDITLVNQDPYGAGWLYAVRGRSDAKSMDVHAYKSHLDKTIDKILEKRKSAKIRPEN